MGTVSGKWSTAHAHVQRHRPSQHHMTNIKFASYDSEPFYCTGNVKAFIAEVISKVYRWNKCLRKRTIQMHSVSCCQHEHNFPIFLAPFSENFIFHQVTMTLLNLSATCSHLSIRVLVAVTYVQVSAKNAALRGARRLLSTQA